MAKAVLWSPGAVCCEKQPEAAPLATPSLIFLFTLVYLLVLGQGFTMQP